MKLTYYHILALAEAQQKQNVRMATQMYLKYKDKCDKNVLQDELNVLDEIKKEIEKIEKGDER